MTFRNLRFLYFTNLRIRKQHLMSSGFGDDDSEKKRRSTSVSLFCARLRASRRGTFLLRVSVVVAAVALSTSLWWVQHMGDMSVVSTDTIFEGRRHNGSRLSQRLRQPTQWLTNLSSSWVTFRRPRASPKEEDWPGVLNDLRTLLRASTELQNRAEALEGRMAELRARSPESPRAHGDGSENKLNLWKANVEQGLSKVLMAFGGGRGCLSAKIMQYATGCLIHAMNVNPFLVCCLNTEKKSGLLLFKF